MRVRKSFIIKKNILAFCGGGDGGWLIVYPDIYNLLGFKIKKKKIIKMLLLCSTNMIFFTR